jgi:glycosyltransferase involved in cell wall biosynthesis
LRVRWAAFGTYDQSRHPRVAVLIEGLRASGDDVVEVNVPLGLDTADRVRMLREPWRLPVLGLKVLRCWTLLARRSRALGPVDGVLVGYLGHFDVRLARRLFRRTAIVLDHLVSATGTAQDRGLASPSGLKYRLLAAIDSGALRSADLILVDTVEHEAALPDDLRVRAVLVPVGATASWFAQGSSRTPRPAQRALRVIFAGVFTPLHGARIIGEALARLADEEIDVTMVGSGQDLAACRAAAAGNPRVTWIDWVQPADLPALTATMDVNLGIFGITPKAMNVVPTKVFQGAAAGCAVVTSDTSPQREAFGDAAVYVPAGDPAALADALRRLAHDPAEVSRRAAAAHAVACERYRPVAVVAPMRDRFVAMVQPAKALR